VTAILPYAYDLRRGRLTLETRYDSHVLSYQISSY